jgi:hypothetical protein
MSVFLLLKKLLYPLQRSCRGGILVSPCPSICRQILCCMITWVVFLRMFWNFISSLPVKRGGSLSFLTILTFAIPELLDMIWRKIGFLPYVVWYNVTWLVFLRMFWNFISSLPVKRGGSLSFLVGTISNVLVMEIGWTDVGSEGYIFVSTAHSNTSLPLTLSVHNEVYSW